MNEPDSRRREAKIESSGRLEMLKKETGTLPAATINEFHVLS